MFSSPSDCLHQEVYAQDTTRSHDAGDAGSELRTKRPAGWPAIERNAKGGQSILLHFSVNPPSSSTTSILPIVAVLCRNGEFTDLSSLSGDD
jgi:hypothetical protein